MHCFVWKLLHFDSNCTERYSWDYWPVRPGPIQAWKMHASSYSNNSHQALEARWPLSICHSAGISALGCTKQYFQECISKTMMISHWAYLTDINFMTVWSIHIQSQQMCKCCWKPNFPPHNTGNRIFNWWSHPATSQYFRRNIFKQHQHIEAETKWPPFSRRHFQMDFLEWKCMNFDSHFTEVCS